MNNDNPLVHADRQSANPLPCLQVAADICPQVLLRVLGLFAQRNIIPSAISFSQEPQFLQFEITVDGLTPR